MNRRKRKAHNTSSTSGDVTRNASKKASGKASKNNQTKKKRRSRGKQVASYVEEELSSSESSSSSEQGSVDESNSSSGDETASDKAGPWSKKRGRPASPGSQKKTKKNPRMSEYFEPYFPKNLEVEKILGYRRVNSENEYLIKWKGYSYLHTEWKGEHVLRKLNGKNARRIDKYHRDEESEGEDDSRSKGSQDTGGEIGLDIEASGDADELFNSDFTMVQRILAYYVDYVGEKEEAPFDCAFDDKGVLVTKGKHKGSYEHAYVLVKWAGLPYCDMTWEPAGALDKIVYEQKLKVYNMFKSFDVRKFGDVYAPLKSDVKRVDPKNFKRLTGNEVYRGLENDNVELKLRDYQVEGVNWLLWNWCTQRPGSLLADEMGLGKTIQVIAMFEELRRGRTIMSTSSPKKQKWMRTRGPHLVVVPLSCAVQWQREFETWTDMNVIVYHGDQDSRGEIQDYEFNFRNCAAHDGEDGRTVHGDIQMRFNVLITTYELAAREATLLRKIPWRCLVVDEGHRLKNRDSRLNRELAQYRRDFTILLTGTPIQNNTSELWSLLNFVTTKCTRKGSQSGKSGSKDETEMFHSDNREEFLETYGSVTSNKQVTGLHSLLRPFLLRRVKEDVALSLPPKKETIVEVELTVDQKKFYRGIYEKNTSFLFRGGKASNGPSLMNIMMELRKCCNHPFLNRGVEDMIVENQGKELSEKEQDDLRAKKLVDSSGKLILLDKLLPKLESGGHRVLIFSQMVKMLDILGEYCHMRDFPYERLDGSVTGMDRQSAIDRFSAPGSKSFIMLLSTRAGGLGLNLACADTVIIYDSDWNPQNDLQAQARSHRIGQTRAVKVYRLITRKTYEMVMFQKASVKLGLDKAMLSKGKEGEEGKITLTAKEVDLVLKHGAYAAFGESEEASDEASKEFANASIEKIMENASHTVDYSAAEKESNTKNSILAAFSTAVFVHKQEDKNIDMDDPEFWKKVAGFEEPDPAHEAKKIILQSGKKRARKAVVRMGMIGLGEQWDDKHGKSLDLMKGRRKSEKSKRRQKEKNFVKNPWAWTDRARDSVIAGLKEYGWGKWEQIRESGSLEAYGDTERVERFAAACVRAVYAYASDTNAKPSETAMMWNTFEAGKTGKEIVEMAKEVDLSADDIVQGEKVLTKRSFIAKMLNGGARSLFEHLHLIKSIVDLVDECETQMTEELTKCITVVNPPKPDPGDIDVDRTTLMYSVSWHQNCSLGLSLCVCAVGESDHLWVVQGIAENSIAAKGGFIKVGDILRTVNGFKADKMDTLTGLMDALFSPDSYDGPSVDMEDGESESENEEEAFKVSGNDEDSDTSSEGDPFNEGDKTAAGDDEDASLAEKQNSEKVMEFASGNPWSIRLATVNSRQRMVIGADTEVKDASVAKIEILKVKSKEQPSPSWSVEKIVEWIRPVILGRELREPILRFLSSKSSDIDPILAPKVCEHVKQEQAKEEQVKTDPEPDAKNETGMLALCSENQWEEFCVSVCSRILHEKNILSKPYNLLGDMRLCDGKVSWTRQMDMHLLLGVARYGLDTRDMDYLAADPAFIFAQTFGIEKAADMLKAKARQEQEREEERRRKMREALKRKREKKLLEAKQKATESKTNDETKSTNEEAETEKASEGTLSRTPSGVSRKSLGPVIVGPSVYLPSFGKIVLYLETLLYGKTPPLEIESTQPDVEEKTTKMNEEGKSTPSVIVVDEDIEDMPQKKVKQAPSEPVEAPLKKAKTT